VLERLGYDQEPSSRLIEKVVSSYSKGASVILRYSREDKGGEASGLLYVSAS